MRGLEKKKVQRTTDGGRGCKRVKLCNGGRQIIRHSKESAASCEAFTVFMINGWIAGRNGGVLFNLQNPPIFYHPTSRGRSYRGSRSTGSRGNKASVYSEPPDPEASIDLEPPDPSDSKGRIRFYLIFQISMRIRKEIQYCQLQRHIQLCHCPPSIAMTSCTKSKIIVDQPEAKLFDTTTPMGIGLENISKGE
ncbi:hypothetical protein SUGI_0346580 [Cryptomeria japonica]|nr:hypothetical protein SUGI_0346580 [Cryptomeria japonica]